MTESDQKYLDAKFEGLHAALRDHAALNAEENSNIHGRIDSVIKGQESLTGRLWGLAAAALVALITALAAIATGQKAH